MMSLQEKRDSQGAKDWQGKLFVSSLALLFAIAHLSFPELEIDVVTVSLIVIAVLPWLANMISSAEMPGGWKIQFRELEERQNEQAAEIASLKFLVAGFVSQHELEHLQALAGPAPFEVRLSSATNEFFEKELRRMRELGLIENLPGKGIRTLLSVGGNVKDHFYVTDRGKLYLRLRQELLQESVASAADRPASDH